MLIDPGGACPVGPRGPGARLVGAVAPTLVEVLLALGALLGLEPVDRLPGGAPYRPRAASVATGPLDLAAQAADSFR
jgi:hypothetical protein